MEAARELFAARNYSSVVAVATHAIEDDVDDLDMRLLRANALVALRRDQEAQADLQQCLRLRSRCALAYRLLGELCFRRDEYDSAVVFLREAARLDGDDSHASDLLEIARQFLQSTAAVENLPAATAAVDCSSRASRPASGTATPLTRSPFFDGATNDLNGPTELHAWPVSHVGVEPFTGTDVMDSVTLADPPNEDSHRELYVGLEDGLALSQPELPPTVPQRPRARVAFGSEHDLEPTLPDEKRREHESFGMFLLRIGSLTPNQLHAAFDYQRRTQVSLAAAIIELGYATEPTIRTAGLAFRAERGIRR